MAKSEIWWKASKQDAHSALLSWVEGVERRQGSRQSRLLHYLRLYGDRDLLGVTRSSTRSQRRDPRAAQRRLSINVVQNAVDAFTSIHSRSRPHATFTSIGGDYTLQNGAKQRERLVDAIFYEAKVYEMRQRAIKMATLTGDGFLRVLPDNGRVAIEQVFPGEILVDDIDGYYAAPRALSQQKCIDRYQAAARWKSSSDAILKAPEAGKAVFGRDPSSDQILVTEAWRLPSGPSTNDGRHCIVVDGATLLSEPYKRNYFPFAHWRYSEDPIGFWGTGLGELLTGIQFEINQVLKTIAENVYNGGNIKIFVEQGSNVLEEQIHNSLKGALIEYTGKPPNFHVHDVFSPQIMQYLQFLIDTAYRITGLGGGTTTGEMPAGLQQSGRAQLVFKRIESERFAAFSRSDEAAFLQLARAVVDTAHDLSEAGDYKVKHVGDVWLDELDVGEVLNDNYDAYELQVEGSSQLPHDLAGRVAIVDHLEQTGRVDRSQSNKMMDMPDTRAYFTLENAPMDLVDRQIEKILEDGDLENNLPDERMDLQLALQRGLLAYNRARVLEAPLERLDLLSQWIDFVQEKLEPPPEAAPVVDPNALPPEMGAPPDASMQPPVANPGVAA